MADGELAGQAAIVTGAGTGIGAEIAQRLASEGANVTVLGRREGPLKEIAALIDKADGGDCLVVAGDVSQEADVESLFARTIERFGQIDILVNNAGIAGDVGSIWELSLAGWSEALGVNLTGPWLTCRAAAKAMIPRRSGKIINIGSISGKRPLAQRTPYTASKLGLVGLTRSLALELGPHNINVNVISPGAVDTPRLEELAQKYNVTKDQIVAASAEKRALQRIPTTNDIAELTVFLAGERSKNITGFDITVDAGGWFT